jgi:hypothetical protein
MSHGSVVIIGSVSHSLVPIFDCPHQPADLQWVYLPISK